MTATVQNDSVIRTAGHRYFAGDRELLGVTRILQLAGVTDFSAPWYTDWVKDRGQKVHEMIALENEGTLDEELVDDRLRGYLEGYRTFRAEVGGELEWHEQIVADHVLGLAGTFDLMVRHPDDRSFRRRLYDIKPADEAATAVQLAAYARLARGLYSDTILIDRFALIIPGDGTYKTIPCDNPQDDTVFLAALRVAHWKHTHGRR